MTPTLLRRLAAALIAATLLGLLLAAGCSQSPPEPEFANPFDPATPGSEDPFNLRAIYNGGTVTLAWTPRPGHGIAAYVVVWLHEGNTYDLARLVPSEGQMTYIVTDPLPNALNRYRIRAVDAFERAMGSSHIVPAQVMVPPIIRLSSGQTSVRTRYQDVVVRAAVGDYVQLDTTSTFATAWQAALGADSTAVFAGFDLGPQPDAAARCTLFARAAVELGGGLPPSWSATDTRVLTIQFAPTIIRPDSSTTIARPATDLVISNQAIGVVSMRFASSEAGLSAAAWQPGAPLAVGVPLLDTTQPQTLHAEFLSDFGFTRRTTLNLRADDLTGATFRLVLPANRIATTPRVATRGRARATEMRISQDPGFQDAPWAPYALDSEVVIEGEPGLYQVYAWFRNHWYESAILTDHVILSGASLHVAFTHPTEGQVVRGGSTLTLAGTAATFDGDFPLTLVEVHRGDGWQPASGTAHWSALWTVPRFDADTPVQIGARATATGPGGATHDGVVWITVLVSQLAVRIDSPEPGASATRGGTLEIAGTAAPFLGGAALDSVVVVTPDGVRLAAAPPLASWSVDWEVPADHPLGAANLAAFAYAGDDSVVYEVPIEVVD